MDRRQMKTRNAIFQATCRLLEQKRFNNITVQEIIDEANVGRSTFYAHFETKDVLLRELCTDIFEHVFSHNLKAERSHDFSESTDELDTELTHLIYHLKDNKGNIIGILTGESQDEFLKYFKEYLMALFSKYPKCFGYDLPRDYILNHLAGSFIETVKWWIQKNMTTCPEELTAMYLKIIKYDNNDEASHMLA